MLPQVIIITLSESIAVAVVNEITLTEVDTQLSLKRMSKHDGVTPFHYTGVNFCNNF